MAALFAGVHDARAPASGAGATQALDSPPGIPLRPDVGAVEPGEEVDGDDLDLVTQDARIRIRRKRRAGLPSRRSRLTAQRAGLAQEPHLGTG